MDRRLLDAVFSLDFLSSDLLIIDGFGLQELTAQQSTDLHELIIARDCHSSFTITNNRAGSKYVDGEKIVVIDILLTPPHLLAMLSRIEKGTIRFGLSVWEGG